MIHARIKWGGLPAVRITIPEATGNEGFAVLAAIISRTYRPDECWLRATHGVMDFPGAES